MRIREVIRKIRMRKIYYGANRIAYIGENVSLPNNIRVPGGYCHTRQCELWSRFGFYGTKCKYNH